MGDGDHGCYGVESWANDKASSVDTHGRCFLLFQHGDCRGDHRRVEPSSCCHNNFKDLGFNDVVSSYKQC